MRPISVDGRHLGRTEDCRMLEEGMRLRFAEFEFDPSTGELTKGGSVIPLQPQPAKILAILVQRPSQIITRTELQNEVWDESTHVDYEQGLNWCIRRLREVLGDTPNNPRFIHTLPKRGYRFVADVKECRLATPESACRLCLTPWKTAALTLGVIAVSVILWFAKRPEIRSRHPITVLVLPFDNVSPSQSGSEFQEIASDQLVAKLAQIDPRRLSVIDPLTARKFKNTKECIIEIGSRLGADYVLLGEVDPSSDAVKVHAQLFQVSTNRQVWASEGEVPRRAGETPVWDNMGGAVGAQLINTTQSDN
jgi:DNA-binding winged helix-turn-helix (wHTH) protein/TolB-like protein